jgi:anti-sigma factor RsiW
MTTDKTPLADETLMAYADGELEPASRLEVEAAMAADPDVARRVEQHRAFRKKLRATFDPVLLETVPDSLVSAIRASSRRPAASAGASSGASSLGDSSQPSQAQREATVTDLRRVRAARAAEAKESAAARRASQPRRPWTWVETGAMAASLVAGAVIAYVVMNSPSAERIGTRGGELVAQGDLEQALSNQLAGDQSGDAPVQIGVSFKSKAGDHCRTFVVREQSPLGGLACRQGDAWRVQVVAAANASAGEGGGYRPASADMPAAVITVVEQQINGEPLDASAEAAARSRGWK